MSKKRDSEINEEVVAFSKTNPAWKERMWKLQETGKFLVTTYMRKLHGDIAFDDKEHPVTVQSFTKVLNAFEEEMMSALSAQRKEIEGLRIPKPVCYCKTHPEHNCGITSNEAIDDVLKILR